MACGTRPGKFGFSSTTQTTRMEAIGCATTALSVSTAGTTSCFAEWTTSRLAESGSGSSTRDYASQHTGPISNAVAARNAQIAILHSRHRYGLPCHRSCVRRSLLGGSVHGRTNVLSECTVPSRAGRTRTDAPNIKRMHCPKSRGRDPHKCSEPACM